MARKIIIDTDPGQDDAIAILLALASPEQVDVLGITTVAGNVPVSFTSTNALKVCELARRPDTKVYVGSDGPLHGTAVTAEHIHGTTGLDGPDLPNPAMPLQPESAIDFIVEALRTSQRGEITLCTLGPLTNVARALRQAPEIAPKIREIVMMGGGFFEGGNISPTAEFNMYVDPEAADIVLRTGVPIVMIPLDVTHQLLTLKRRIDTIRALGSPVGKAVAEMLEFAERFDKEKYGADGGPLHDPTVIAYLLAPELFRGKMCNVQIELSSPLTRGMTVVDWWHVTSNEPNLTYMRYVDDEGFFALLTERLARL